MNNSPRFCYVVATRDDPQMLVMTHVAILTLKLVHNQAQVTLLVDGPTRELIDDAYPVLRDEVDDLVAVDSGIQDAAASSRYLKTRMRDILDGDLLFLDIDTLVLRDLAPLWDHDAVTSGIHDDNTLGGRFSDELLDGFKQLGWPAPAEPYLNSGVMFWRDNADGRRLGEAWHRFWLASRKIMGDTDQPALHRAMTQTGVSLKLLPQDYNQKVRDTPGMLKHPAILHYETRSALHSRHTLINHLMRQMNENGRFDESLLERARRRNDPWGSAGPGIKGNWRTGRYEAALLECLKRLAGPLWPGGQHQKP
jgi:nucleotide-diphospho-sugar transferase